MTSVVSTTQREEINLGFSVLVLGLVSAAPSGLDAFVAGGFEYGFALLCACTELVVAETAL